MLTTSAGGRAGAGDAGGDADLAGGVAAGQQEVQAVIQAGRGTGIEEGAGVEVHTSGCTVGVARVA